MKLPELKKLLAAHADKHIRFLLPTGTKVPVQAHVTEVARIDKRFIDCGGKFRTEFTCRLQTWFADDSDHRLTSAKLLGILNQSASFLETENLDVEVEYEAPFISQFPVTAVEAEGKNLVLRLGVKHTECLAEDRCLPPSLTMKSTLLTPVPNVGKTQCC